MGLRQKGMTFTQHFGLDWKNKKYAIKLNIRSLIFLITKNF